MLNQTYLGHSQEFLESTNGSWTAREICQQPQTLKKTFAIIKSMQSEILGFLNPILKKPNLRIIFAGAGTSAFIGDSIAPHLNEKINQNFLSIPTTDLVSNPNSYLKSDIPTLLVSFGRSGNSPESAASISICDKIVSDINHLIITCNSEGLLAKSVKPKNSLVINLPNETHDNGFAMTSSYSAMVLAALCCFEGVDKIEPRIPNIINAVSFVIDNEIKKIEDLVGENISRVAFLGSGPLFGLAHEGALKLLELTNGKIPTNHETSLGFRHGPKTFVNSNTLIIMFLANNEYMRKYDIDLLGEIMRDGEAKKIFAISAIDNLPLAETDKIIVTDLEDNCEIDLLFPMIVVAQIFAFLQSLKHKITPDNPNPSGAVNRVVQGVKIHELVND